MCAEQFGPEQVTVRRYEPGEEAEIWSLYRSTTHIVNGRDYTPEQCERWAPSSIDTEHWSERLRKTAPWVAVAAGRIVGFAELDDEGEVGYFYCHHESQRKGLGKLLFAALEEAARAQNLNELRADVSTSAKEFFSAMGFEIVSENNKIICGAPARNFTMRKSLAPRAGL